jgi:hypothetical protein
MHARERLPGGFVRLSKPLKEVQVNGDFSRDSIKVTGLKLHGSLAGDIYGW